MWRQPLNKPAGNKGDEHMRGTMIDVNPACCMDIFYDNTARCFLLDKDFLVVSVAIVVVIVVVVVVVITVQNVIVVF